MDIEKLKGYRPKPIGTQDEYSVAIILYDDGYGDKIIFELRSEKVSQPGELSLPGGHRESTESLYECALRETAEELGIKADDLIYLGRSDYLVESKGVIYPFVFRYSPGKSLKTELNDEVGNIVLMELDYFLKVEPKEFTSSVKPEYGPDFPYGLLPGGRDYNFFPLERSIPIYMGTEPLLWGITAKIVKCFVKLIKER